MSRLFDGAKNKALQEFIDSYMESPVGREARRDKWEGVLISYLKGQYILQMEKGEKPHVTLYPELVEEVKRNK